MARQIVQLPNLVIPISQSNSNVVSSKTGFSHIVELMFFNPATFTGVVTILVGAAENMTIGNMVPLYISGANVTLTAGKGQSVPVGGFKSLAIQSGGTEAAARTVSVLGKVDI